MSSYLQFSTPNFYPQHPHTSHYHLSQTTPPHLSENNRAQFDDESIISHALALLHPTRENYMNDYSRDSQPNIRVESFPPTTLPPGYDTRHDSVISAYAPSASDWQMYHASMNGSAAIRRPLKRARIHQRTPSASTVASNGPESPYTANTSYPHIANTDFSPNSPLHYADQALFPKDPSAQQQTATDATYVSQGYVPSHIAHTSGAHLPMKGFSNDYYTSDDFAAEFIRSSRHSMSSGHDSPATPQSGAGDHVDARNFSVSQNGEIGTQEPEGEIDYLLSNEPDFRPAHPNLQLYGTESQAYQDELYNPQTFTSTPLSATKRQPDYLSPHRNLVSERLQTANLARSGSPISNLSRERSPFRDGSPLAPTGDWASAHPVGTAAGMRQQQKEEAEQAEYAQHMPQLQREPTKTISPKDALLEYTEADQVPLFQDNVPAGYRKHSGGTETWQSSFVHQPTSTFGNLSAPVTNAQQMTPFRATSADGFNAANFGYLPLPPTHPDQSSQIQATPFQSHTYAAPKMNYSDADPEFPATLTSMESSVSESGPPLSQENYNTSEPIQRPLDTRANTGTYTCTYHGCAQRFDSHINLQKHKRDFHRSQQQREATSTEEDYSTSARSSQSPAPSASGMTSAQVLARNSQAGPHKCSRINPSTGKPCNTIFSRPYDLTRHEDTIHNNRKQKVRCPICREEKTFSRNDALTRHMRVVHPEVEAFGKRSRRGD